MAMTTLNVSVKIAWRVRPLIYAARFVVSLRIPLSAEWLASVIKRGVVAQI
jgi:hypothetical protein